MISNITSFKIKTLYHVLQILTGSVRTTSPLPPVFPFSAFILDHYNVTMVVASLLLTEPKFISYLRDFAVIA